MIVRLLDRADGLFDLDLDASATGVPGTIIYVTASNSFDASYCACAEVDLHLPGASEGTLLNEAISRSSCEHIAILAGDIRPNSGWLGSLLKEARKSGAPLVGGRVVSSGRIVTTGLVTDPSGDIGMRHRLSGTLQNGFEALQRSELFAPAPCMYLISRDGFEQCEGFDDRLDQPFTTVDLAMRLRNAGMKSIYCSRAVGESLSPDSHLLSPTGENTRRMGLFLKSADRFFERWAAPNDESSADIKSIAAVSERWRGSIEQGGGAPL